MRRTVVALAMLLAASAATAQELRHYEVIGTNPADGSTYAGDVLVEQSGEVFHLEWSLGGRRITGVGVSDGKHLAVTYGGSGPQSMALYRQEGPGWTRIWTAEAGFKAGTEYWIAW